MIQTAVIHRPLCSTTGRRKPVRLPSAVDCSSRRSWVLAVARNGVGKKNAVTCRSLSTPTRPRQQVGFARIIDLQITSSRLRMSLREPSLHLIETREDHWTSDEIKSCCRLASLLDVPLVQAAQNVVPVAVTAGDKIESLRQWASGRFLSADRAGVYSRSESGGGGRRRRVMKTLRDSNRLRQMVARDFEQIQASVGEMLVDRPRRNILRRGNVGGAV